MEKCHCTSPSKHQKTLSILQAAELRDCNPVTIRRMIARGDLKAYRFGRLIRIKPEDLNKALKPVTNVGALLDGEC